jgi:fatty acid desaturase
MEEHDIEARSARMTALQALAFGPLFPFMLHRHALREGNDYYRTWIRWELRLNAVLVVCVTACVLMGGPAALTAHVLAMIAGQCLTAFFAVWTVHHDCDGDIFARTQRGWLKNFVSYNMFFHVEHHLFPRVPQRNLPALAARLDEACPELSKKTVY